MGFRSACNYEPGGSLDREAFEAQAQIRAMVLGSSSFGALAGLGGDGGGGRHRHRQDETFPDPDLARSIAGVLEVHRHLGSGSFADVWECTVKDHEDRVAVKILEGDYSEHQAREWQLLAEVQHPNLVRMLLAIEGKPCAMVLELCCGGTLAQLIHAPDRRGAFSTITTQARVQALLDVISGVEYLHSKTILHRDVKPSNCLLKSMHKVCMEWIPQVKLADLGLARHEAQAMSKRVGTLIYMAPELMEGNQYSFPVDIYSCGMVLYEIITSILPFSTSDSRLQNDVAFILAVDMGQRPNLDDVPFDAAGQEIRSILQLCWDHEASNRPTASVLSEHLRTLLAVMLG